MLLFDAHIIQYIHIKNNINYTKTYCIHGIICDNEITKKKCLETPIRQKQNLNNIKHITQLYPKILNNKCSVAYMIIEFVFAAQCMCCIKSN